MVNCRRINSAQSKFFLEYHPFLSSITCSGVVSWFSGWYWFLCPQARRSGGGGYCFCPVCHSVIPSFCHSLWNFNLAYNFWTAYARALIFHMSIPCDKTFQWYYYFLPCGLDLGVWPNFLKTLILLISFEQWVLRLWYFTWIFLVIRPFRGYHYFLPCDLDLGVLPIFWKF